MAAAGVIHLYVDGSCLGNQNVDSQTPAGWGVVIVTGDTGLGKGSGESVEAKSGKVIRDARDEDFTGAELRPNTTGE